MITFTQFPLASVEEKLFHFLLFRINNLDRNFLYRQTLSLTCPLRNHVTSFLSRQSIRARKMAGCRDWSIEIASGGDPRQQSA